MVSKLEEKNLFTKKGEGFKVLCVCLKNASTGQDSEHSLIFLFLLLFISRAFVPSCLLTAFPFMLVPLILCK